MKKIGYLGIIVLSVLGAAFYPQFTNADETRNKLLEAVKDADRHIDQFEIANHALAITRIVNNIKEGKEELREAATLIEESRNQLAEVGTFTTGSDKEKTLKVISSLGNNLERIAELLDKVAGMQQEILDKRNGGKLRGETKKAADVDI